MNTNTNSTVTNSHNYVDYLVERSKISGPNLKIMFFCHWWHEQFLNVHSIAEYLYTGILNFASSLGHNFQIRNIYEFTCLLSLFHVIVAGFIVQT